MAGSTPIFMIRLTSDSHYVAFQNGFRIYSDDGAEWVQTTPDTTALNWGRMFDYLFKINSYNIDGTGADTVSYVGTALFGSGFNNSFDEIAYKIMIGPLPGGPDNNGKTICIDSISPPSGSWIWTYENLSTVKPNWEGPYCFTIADAPTDIPDSSPGLPEQFCLHQNYPNPFNPKTTIQFEIPIKTIITFSIYTITGRKIHEQTDVYPPGIHTIFWDGTQYASGVYFYKLRAGLYSGSRKMILLK